MRWIILASAFGLTSCVVAHRDVMVFGTDTSFGISVGADPVSSQVANVSIGYKRREAVWMPLLVNGQDTRAFCEQWNSDGTCARPVGASAVNENWSPKYTSEAAGVDATVGGNESEKDTYSVFASFGGDASAATGKGRVAVAQFFATGIAAQRLGSNPSAARLVSTAPDVDAEGEKAKGKVEAWEEMRVASAAQHEENIAAVKPNLEARHSDDVRIAEYVFAGASATDRRAKLDQLLADVELPERYRGQLQGSLGERGSFETVLAGEFNNWNGPIAEKIPADSN